MSIRTSPEQPVAAAVGTRAEDDRDRSWCTFLRAHALVTRALEVELQEARGISLAEYDALARLAVAPEGRLRMSELAERIVLSRSGVSRLVDRLESEGYVERTVCSSDARGAFARLTPQGLQQLQLAEPIHLRGVGAHFEDLVREEEREMLRAVLERIVCGAEGSPSA